jgi:hypothetical protein
MSDEIVSGGGAAAVKTRRCEKAFLTNDPVQASGSISLTSQADASGIETPAVSVSNDYARSPRSKGAAKPSVDRPENRHAIRRYWQVAEEKAAAMLAAAKEEDITALFNAGRELDYQLDELWKLRAAREPDWAEVLNYLQCVLKTVRKERKLEELSAAHCEAFQRIIHDYLSPATTDREDVRSCVHLLKSIGFDPWRSVPTEQCEE